MSGEMQGKILANRFRLDRQLGKGGMGSVWIAEHLTLRSNVAVKLMDPEIAASPEGADRFRREAQAAASLRSAHVVQVLDYGVDEGTPYLVMELLHGENLARCLEREQRLTPARTFTVMSQVARAVGRAHAASIVHRDLKPDNVFLVHEDGHELVKVLDFGIAKTKEPSFGGLETRTGVTIGTPYYMSPEQAEGKKAVDHRTDLWALSVITSECLTGVRPFNGETWGELLLNICARPLPVPSAQGPVPPGFDAWFAKATTREVEQRFNSAQEWIASLGECLEPAGDRALPTGRAFGEKGGTVVQNTGPIVALPPPVTGGSGQGPVTGGSGQGPVTAGTGQSLELNSEVRGPRRRGVLFPIAVALGAVLVIGGGAALAGFGVWTWVRGQARGEVSDAGSAAPAAASGGAPGVSEGDGGQPAPEPTQNTGGRAPEIAPVPTGSPFEGLIPSNSAEPPRPKLRDDGARPIQEPARPNPNQSPNPNPSQAPGSRPPKSAQCYADPFTGAIRLASKARPAEAKLFPCKQNPFTGQYQKL